jgi:hypothetical protein
MRPKVADVADASEMMTEQPPAELIARLEAGNPGWVVWSWRPLRWPTWILGAWHSGYLYFTFGNSPKGLQMGITDVVETLPAPAPGTYGKFEVPAGWPLPGWDAPSDWTAECPLPPWHPDARARAQDIIQANIRANRKARGMDY